MSRCDRCYGDVRGDCIRVGRCIFEPRRMKAPTRFLLGGLLMLAAMGIAIIVYGVGH